ncbi:MAG: chromate efflux transporter [Pseudomonadota bacterium]|nr:chromate efflux transporter [Pseudomonadota bacterium]
MPAIATTPPSDVDLIRSYTRLGLTSFGGPVAHIGYYRTAFIERTHWMDDEAFAERLALCQALPGPTSSQMAFACAWHMSGRLSLAFVCLGLFLLPSMLILLALGLFFVAAASGGLGLNGLQAFMGHLSDWMVPLVIAVITHATLGMARSLSVGAGRRLTTILAFAIVLALPLWDFGSLQVFAQLAPILFGAAMGLLFLRERRSAEIPAGAFDSKTTTTAPGAPESAAAQTQASDNGRARADARALIGLSLLAFSGLLTAALAIILFDLGPARLQLLAGFYEAGSLVFGGGHVVLPLLNDVLVDPGLVAESAFRTGYGFAQAIPGPVFAVAAFLGGQVGGLEGLLLGVLGTAVIFLPGVLLVMAVVPLSASFARNRAYRAALAGVNAAVVGLLGATAFSLFFLLWTPGALVQHSDTPLPQVGAALVGLFMLWVLRLPPLLLIGLTLAAALITTLL